MTDLWDTIRKDFPITSKSLYLDHAAGGPIPMPVVEASKKYYEEHATEADFAWNKWMARREKIRADFAKFIHAEPEEVAFIDHTSHGINIIAELLHSEGAVLSNKTEFPSSTLPWIQRGTPVIWQEPEERGVLHVEKLRAKMTPEIKTIVASLVGYSTGYRQDVEEIGKMKGDRFFVLNATQGFGVLPIDVKKWNVDFMVANSYKWFMAGYGGGVLYIKKEWLRKFKPTTVGWRSVSVPEAMVNDKVDVALHARRYEMGCPNMPVIFTMGAALDYFNKIGIEKIEKRILELTAYLIQKLKKLDFQILSSEKDSERAGIVMLQVESPEKVWKELIQRKVFTMLRGKGLRVAPHFYNNYEDLDRFIRIMREVTHKT